MSEMNSTTRVLDLDQKVSCLFCGKDFQVREIVFAKNESNGSSSSLVDTVFEKAMDGLTGVGYEPVGYLGEKDGVYCILCRATVVYPDAKPYYALVYVSDEGLQNIWDIWMGAHAEKKN